MSYIQRKSQPLFEQSGSIFMSYSWRWHDLHVHTRPHSPDAHWRASLRAMLKRAAKNGVPLVGLANHYFPPTNFKIFQKLRQQVPKKVPAEMIVLVGAELCVLDPDGKIALTDEEATQLDFILAGPHHFKQRWVEQPPKGDATAFVAHQHQMLLGAARNPHVDFLAHPWMINIQHAPQRWGFDPADFLAAWSEDHFVELAQELLTHNTAVEIGMGIHFMADYQGLAFWEKYKRGLQILQANGVKFYFGSDAHHLHVIGRLDWLEPTLNQLGFTPDDIIDPLALLQAKRR